SSRCAKSSVSSARTSCSTTSAEPEPKRYSRRAMSDSDQPRDQPPAGPKRSVAKAALLSFVGVAAVLALWLRTGGLPEDSKDSAQAGDEETTALAGEGNAQPVAPEPDERLTGWTLADDRAVLRGETMGTTFSLTLAGRHEFADLGRYAEAA